MFARNQSINSRMLLAGLMSAVLLAALPASANAAFSPPFDARCSGKSILGVGTPSQAIAQEAWFKFWRTNTTARRTGGCGPWADQVVHYLAVHSENPVAAYFATHGLFHVARFAASDVAPDVDQRLAIEQSASNHGPARLNVVPAAQSAITMIVNFPKHCELRAGDPDLAPYARFKVPNERLLPMWFGDPSTDSWGELLPGIKAIPGGSRSDESCRNQAIERVVPGVDTHRHGVFKRFLSRIAPSRAGHELRTGSGVTTVAGARQLDLAREVSRKQGSIAVVDLPAARAAGFQKQHDSHSVGSAYTYSGANQQADYPVFGRKYSFKKSLFWIPVESANAAGNMTGNFVEPTFNRVSIRNGQRGSNCKNVLYNNVPTNALGAVDPQGDWSVVSALFASDRYPLCTMSYLAFWDDYADVYNSNHHEQGRARTVKDFITTSVYSGQHELYKRDYAPVPWHQEQNLRFVAQRAIQLMGWNKP